MTDRELLKLAAKAAGFQYNPTKVDPYGLHGCFADDPSQTCYLWSPLTDDGDALRLAVKCNIDLILTHSDIESAFDHKSKQHAESRNPDPYAATRRAIVRAAAEIGRSVK